MKFRDLHDLCNSICEYHWEGEELTVMVDDYMFESAKETTKHFNQRAY